MKSFPRILTLTLVVITAVVLLAACRPPQISANPTGNPATATPGGGGGGGDPELETMAAVSTHVSAAATQQASGPAVGETLQPGETSAPQPSNTPASLNPAPTETPALLPPTATPIAPVGAGCPNPYTVKAGEWIYKIARDCKVEPSAIIALNPGVNPDRVVPGQTLNMPAAGATAVPPATPLAQACSGSYTIKSGDNLWRIAYGCGLTVESLAAANAVPFPYTIYVGDVIKFP
jgi:LysM repeat protein